MLSLAVPSSALSSSHENNTTCSGSLAFSLAPSPSSSNCSSSLAPTTKLLSANAINLAGHLTAVPTKIRSPPSPSQTLAPLQPPSPPNPHRLTPDLSSPLNLQPQHRRSQTTKPHNLNTTSSTSSTILPKPLPSRSPRENSQPSPVPTRYEPNAPTIRGAFK